MPSIPLTTKGCFHGYDSNSRWIKAVAVPERWEVPPEDPVLRKLTETDPSNSITDLHGNSEEDEDEERKCR